MKIFGTLLSIGSIVAIIIAFIVGFWFGKHTTQVAQTKQETSHPLNNHALLFGSKSAEIQGKFVSINGDMATIQSNNNSSADFKLAEQVYITKYDSKNKPSYSTKKEDLAVNKQVLITLSLPKTAVALENTDAQFEVTAVTYLPEIK